MKPTGILVTAQKVYTAVVGHRTRNAQAAHAHIKEWNAVSNTIPDFPDQPPARLSKAGYIDSGYIAELKKSYKVLENQRALEAAQRSPRVRVARTRTAPQPTELMQLLMEIRDAVKENTETNKALYVLWSAKPGAKS